MAEPSTPTTDTRLSAGDLKAKLDRGDSLVVFDVRPREMTKAWRVEGRDNLRFVNVPYREMVPQGAADDDPVGKIGRYVQDQLSDELPEGAEIVTVCAKGISSIDVANALRQLDYDAWTLAGGMDAWSDFYDVKTVMETDRLGLYQITRPARGCVSHVVISEGEAAVIDPLRHIDPYRQLVRDHGVEIRYVLDTHAHADHISGGPALAEDAGVDYWLHPYDAIHPIDVLPARLDFAYLQDGQTFRVGDADIDVIHIPGHTLGNVAFRANGQYLLTGDSVFIGSIARPDLGGQGETWAPLHYRSLRRLLELPDDTIVLPGHFNSPDEADENAIYQASLGDLKATNEGLRMAQESERAFVDFILGSLPTFPEQYVDIKRVNAGLIAPEEDGARILETGRNVCALASSAS